MMVIKSVMNDVIRTTPLNKVTEIMEITLLDKRWLKNDPRGIPTLSMTMVIVKTTVRASLET